jgi:P27 family predicted phage terminase small subunit
MKTLEVPKTLNPDSDEFLLWTQIVTTVNELAENNNRLLSADYHVVQMTVKYLLLHRQIMTALDDEELLVDTAARSGIAAQGLKANPLLTQLDKVTTQCIKLMIQLGMTPKARKQLGVESDDEDDTDDEI